MSGTARSVRFWTAGDARRASTRYRVLAHLDALRQAGWESEVRFPLPGTRVGPLGRLRRAADLIRDLTRPVAREVVFIQRKTYPAAVAGWLRRPGRLVVFDFDDAIDLPPPGRPSHPAEVRRHRRNFVATVQAADLVLCGNPALVARVPHGRCEVLPTAVDTERFHPSILGPPGPKTLGWVGHSDNLAYLEALADPLRELSRRHQGLRLVVVADRPPRLAGVEVEFRLWTLDSEVSCFDGMRIGLMPLEDTPWARGKCAFKAIQYLSLGIPVVASPVGTSSEVVERGRSGFLPESEQDWVEALDRLLLDDGLAARMGLAGRQRVEASYSLRVVSRRLLELLDALLARSSSNAAQSRAWDPAS